MTNIATTIEARPVSSDAVRGSEFGWLQQANDLVFEGFEDAGKITKQMHDASYELVLDNKALDIQACDNPITRDDFNQLTVAGEGGKSHGMTRHSFGQICSLAGAPAAHYRTLPAPIVADALHYGLKFNRRVEQVKVYADPYTGLRAITGPTYGRVPDFEVIEAVETLLDNGWVPAKDHMGFRLTDKFMSMFLVDENRPVEITRRNGMRDTVQRGFRFRNSETGAGSLTVDAFLFHGYCLNGQIFGLGDQFKVSIRHTSGAPARWAREIQPAIEHYASTPASDLKAALEATQEAVIAEDDKAAVDWMQARGISRSRGRDVLARVMAEEGTDVRTVWDVTQGLTAIARDERNVDTRGELEELAGKMTAAVAKAA